VSAAQIDLVLFDLDDTLVDHGSAATSALAHAIDRWSPDSSAHDYDALHSLWQEIEREEYDNYLRGRCTHAEQRVRRLRRFLPALGAASGDDAFLAARFGIYLDAYVAAWAPFADVTAALDELAAAGAGVAILTNGDPRQQHLKIERVGLADRFDRILTPTEVGAPKPDAAAFLNACTMLEVDPARTFYVGDNLEVDAVGASAAGLQGIWLDRSGSGTAPAGVTRIASLAELAAIRR
jgi:putative hydrolase of the HAD superfamily